MSYLTKIKQSPNYDKIVNFTYEVDDEISVFLVDCYQKYLSNIKNKKSILNIDNIMNCYIENEEFYKYIQNYFTENKSEMFDSFDKIIIKLNKLYKLYEEEKLKIYQSTRWL